MFTKKIIKLFRDYFIAVYAGPGSISPIGLGLLIPPLPIAKNNPPNKDITISFPKIFFRKNLLCC